MYDKFMLNIIFLYFNIKQRILFTTFALVLISTIKKMAKPIKETPVLTGEDATRFECATNEFVPASNEEKEQAQEAFTFFSSIATFSI